MTDYPVLMMHKHPHVSGSAQFEPGLFKINCISLYLSPCSYNPIATHIERFLFKLF